jgi:hypothetical protein
MREINLLLRQELPKSVPLMINCLGFLGDFGSLNQAGWKFCVSPSHNGARTRFYMKHSTNNIACGSINLTVPWFRKNSFDPDTFEFDSELTINENQFMDVVSYLSIIEFNYMSNIKAMTKIEKIEMVAAQNDIVLPKSYSTEELLDMIMQNEAEKTMEAKLKIKKRQAKPSAMVIDFEKFKNTDARIREILAA